VYSRHGTQQYTCAQTVAAERRILAAATRVGGHRAGADDIELALAESTARGKTLQAGQAALVTEMATSGRRLALALAPAATGKTTAMAALSHAWRSSGGSVIGLAPTANAAIELGGDLHAPTDTVAKYIQLADSTNTQFRHTPAWFTGVDTSTLVIIDEAGKAATRDLEAVISRTLARGASVRLIGDDGQLSSISAGGVLRDIAAQTDALTLSELIRFASPAEGLASLALRAGDPAGIGHYIDHHRAHVGADATAADMAYTAWRADRDAGLESILLAPPTTPSTNSTPAPAWTASPQPPPPPAPNTKSCCPATDLAFRAQSSVQNALLDLQATGLITRSATTAGKTYYRRNDNAAWTFALELLTQALACDEP
jgi:hypothetical protein